MGTMILPLASAIALTGTAIGPAVLTNVTPFLGGFNHNAIVNVNAPLGGAAVVKIQGNAGTSDTTAPVSGDAGWADIATLNAATLGQTEIKLPRWIRYNITTAGTGTLNVTLEGVQ